MIARQLSLTLAQRARKRPRRRSLFIMAGLTALVLYEIGFLLFLAHLPALPAGATAKADGIVALTGQGGRLAPAVTLLENGDGQRLLITGVNKLITKGSLKTLLHGGSAFDCCADLGFSALDTRGNAEEAARWARAHRYGSLVVVTADYHMPRSLVEFHASMPGVKLIPYPVAEDAAKFLSWDSAKRLNGEYVKYLASIVRVSTANLFVHA